MRIKDRRTRLWARAGSGCRKRSHKLPLRRQMLPRKCKARRWTRRTFTFADEMETSGSHSVETKPSRQVPDEDLDEVFRDNRVHDTDGEFDGEQPQAGGNTFDEIDRAARAVKDPKARESDVLQAGKVFHELEGTEFYDMFRRNNARYEARVSEMVETYLASIRPAEKKTRMKAAVRKEYENFNIRDYV